MEKMSYFWRKSSMTLIMLAVLVANSSLLSAQRPRFPDFFQTQQPIQAPPTTLTAPGTVFPAPIQGGIITNPGPATIIAPTFDPFQGSTQTLPFTTPANSNIANTAPVLNFQAPQNVQVLPAQPQFQAPPSFGVPQTFGQQPFFQQPGFQNSPVFPQSGQSGQFLRQFRDDFLPRLLERPRIRHTYLPGSNGNEVQIHDLEFATTLTFPRFIFTNQPVRVTPGFIAHFWDGPETGGPFGTGFDLPETAFSAFLNLEHFSDPNRRAGVETNFTVGIYSDYEHLDSDSLRFTGVALGWVRLNQTNLFKLGIEYFDRLEVKLLPAFGLFIRPTPNLKLDLYFPRPKISQRLPNFRALEVWGYVAGEYGGGNWTVERIGGDDRIDLNDYRALAGVEWIGQRRVSGFAEIGYVFNRELVSDAGFPFRELALEDTFLVRLGVSF